MTLPVGFIGPISGLLCGTLFGYVLQRGGLGNGCTLTGQLRLTDWTVFNVMFTAIIVAATGLYVLELSGWMQASDIYTPTLHLVATLLGGALVGVGMGVGSYCPGTSVVAACEGRIDGLFFFGGLLIGTLAFAGVYERMEAFLQSLPGPDSQTVSELLGLPAWLVLLALAAVATTVGVLTRNVGKPEAAI
jgi:uncharacterized membrane protein YedE/YeeE